VFWKKRKHYFSVTGSVSDLRWNAWKSAYPDGSIKRSTLGHKFSVTELILVLKWSGWKTAYRDRSVTRVTLHHWTLGRVRPTVTQSVSQSILALSPSGTHDRVLAVVKTAGVLSWGVFPDGRTGLSCNRSQSLTMLVIYVYIFLSFLRVLPFL
jgi:hypothetical protein